MIHGAYNNNINEYCTVATVYRIPIRLQVEKRSYIRLSYIIINGQQLPMHVGET